MHDIVDGKCIKEAETKPRDKGQEGKKMPELPIFLPLFPVIENGGQIQFPLIEYIQYNEHDDPDIPKETKGSVTSIDKI